MTIKLMTKGTYNRLLKIFEDYPALTFNNIGFQYLNTDKLIEEELQKFKEVENILAEHITGFSRFSNFRDLRGIPVVRFQYEWTADDENTRYFIGVGYLQLTELLNGFK